MSCAWRGVLWNPLWKTCSLSDLFCGYGLDNSSTRRNTTHPGNEDHLRTTWSTLHGTQHRQHACYTRKVFYHNDLLCDLQFHPVWEGDEHAAFTLPTLLKWDQVPDRGMVNALHDVKDRRKRSKWLGGIELWGETGKDSNCSSLTTKCGLGQATHPLLPQFPHL